MYEFLLIFSSHFVTKRYIEWDIRVVITQEFEIRFKGHYRW